MRLIARLSARVFLPEPLCYNEDWLDISVNYTVDFFRGVFALRMIPPLLRPFAHWFLPQCRKARQHVETATRIIEPEIVARRKRREEALRDGRPVEKTPDALTWMDSAAEKQGTTLNLVWGQLNYALGAIHTTSMTFIYALYDLIDHPEYIPLLREEIESVWKEGEPLTKQVLLELKLMDSFMKESQRLSPF